MKDTIRQKAVSLPRKQKIINELAVNLSSIAIPLAFLSGILAGKGDWGLFWLVFTIYLVVDNATGRLWIAVWKNINFGGV